MAPKPPKSGQYLDTADERSKAINEQYLEWREAHSRLKDSKVPSEGRAYIRHAKTLLHFLEGISEANNFAKAVVFTFKTVVLYESERAENDNRVSCVFLAQANMMEVLLRVNEEMPDLHLKDRDDETLKVILTRMEEEIVACGNSLDTYYKESRLARFIHAQDWKERIADHVRQFDDLRHKVTDRLVLHTAIGVSDIRQSMDRLLNELTTPSSQWQKKVAQLEKKDKEWMSDDEKLKQVLTATQDPTLDLRSLTQAGQGGSMSRDPLKAIREEIQLDLEDLCEKNRAMFDLKLDFHTAKLKEAVTSEASRIIRALDGPHERLQNKELSKLWKEMKWMFCIDRTTFVASLYEYLVDEFFSPPTGAASLAHGETQLEEELNIAETEDLQNSGMQIGALHKDLWTLDYFNIPTYSQRIQLAFDEDNSGFVRISEVNEFARSIPDGFNLAQWCAYRAVGYLYETRIYQLRIRKLFIRMAELQRNILPTNTELFANTFLEITNRVQPLVAGFSWQPAPYVPPELMNLVNKKIVEQDAARRQDLQKFNNYYLDGENTIRMLFGERKNPETYLFQLFALLMEHWLVIEELATRFTLDSREWSRILEVITHVNVLVNNRTKELTAHNSGVDLTVHYGGIFRPYNYDNPPEDSGDYEKEVQLLDAFTLPANMASPDSLGFEVWESYAQRTRSRGAIPYSWGNLLGAAENAKESRAAYDFPLHLYGCSACKAENVIGQAAYHCRECEDEVVLCTDCYKKPAKSLHVEGHDPETHDVLRTLLYFPGYLRTWVRQLAELYVRDVIFLSFNSEESFCHKCEIPLKVGMPVGVCVGHLDTCAGRFICKSCIIHYEDSPDDTHESWHNVLVVPDFGRFETGLNGMQDETTRDASTTVAEEDRIASLETRITHLETKVDNGFALLQKLLAGSNEQQTMQQQALEQSLKDQLSQLSAAVSQQKNALGGGGRQTSGGSARSLPSGGGLASRLPNPPAIAQREEEPEDEEPAEPEDQADEEEGYGEQQPQEYEEEQQYEGGYGGQEEEEESYGQGGYGGYQQENYDDY